ncbi:MAG: hypothetical protein ABW005_12320 [Burkholderiaceae bacterium]
MPSIYLLRRGAASLQKSQTELGSMRGWRLLGGSTLVRDAAAAIRQLRPQMVAGDLQLVDGPVDRLARQMRQWPGRPLLLLLTPSLADDLQLFGTLRLGADAYCIDKGNGQGMVAGLQRLAAGRAQMSPLLARQALEALGLPRSSEAMATSLPAAQDLSPCEGGQLCRAEQHLLSLVAMGLLSEEIALRWRRPEAEIERRLAVIYTRLHRLAPPGGETQAAGGAVSTKLGRAASLS